MLGGVGADERSAYSRGVGEPIEQGVIDLAVRVFGLARAGETEELAAYVDAGVPADLTNEKGDTLLILAAYHGHADTVAALLARGADHSRANDRGQTPLAAAVFKQSADTVRALALGEPFELMPDLGWAALWMVAILAVFVPLAVARYRRS